MRVLVCGGRNYNNDHYVFQVLDALDPRPSLIISGGAKGADSIAIDYAVKRGILYHVYKADWDKHGRAAGPIRNRQMIDEGRPDLVIAFRGHLGTEDMCRCAIRAGVELRRV